jgi:two-component system response regulator TctD
VLLIEDEKPLAEWLCKALGQSGFRVDWLADGAMAQRSLEGHDYDVLVLDLGLPGRSGHEVLQSLRASDLRLPVLVLTARDSLAERVGSLNEGADDFLAKPFALPELEARLMALIRRSRGIEHPRFSCGPLGFDAVSRQFTLNGERMSLPKREHALLQCLLQHSGEPMSRQQVIDRVFSDEDDILPSAVDVLVHRLRRRLENAQVHIATYRGLGYVLEADRAPEP